MANAQTNTNARDVDTRDTIRANGDGSKVSKAMKLINEAQEEKTEQAKEQLRGAYTYARENLTQLGERASAMATKATHTAEQSIQQRPFRYVAGASVVGLIFGYLLAKRK